MELGKETIENIEKFATKEATEILNNSELSIFERLTKKGNQTKGNFVKNVSKLKVRSNETKEAIEELRAYMEEYIKDMINHGVSEEVAFEMAKEKIAAEKEKDYEDEVTEKYKEYYNNIDMARQEALGLYFAGFTLLGITVGSIIGLLLGLTVFEKSFWITFGVSIGLGTLMGISMAMLKNAAIIMKDK